MKASWVLVALVLTLITASARSGAVLEDWYWRNPLPQGNALHNVVFVNGHYVALGELGTILTSSDGTNWVTQQSGTTMDLRDCAYGEGKYVVVGDYGTVLISTNAQTWTSRYPGTFFSLNGISYANDEFVCVGEQTTILTSDDGGWWMVQSSGPWELYDIIFAEGLYLAVGGNAANANSASAQVLLTSSDAQGWTIRVLGNGGPFYSVAHGSGVFAATSGYDTWAGTGALWSSADGLTWTQVAAATVPLPLPIVTFAGGKWILITQLSSPSEIRLSDNLTNWETVFTNTPPLAAIASSGNSLVAAQSSGSFLWSSNALDWTNPHPDLGVPYLFDLAYINGQFVGLNPGKWVLSSNGVAWTTIPAPTNPGTLFNIIFSEGLYVAGGESRSVWVSTNRVDWTNAAVTLSSDPYAGDTRVTYGNGIFVAVAGIDSSVLTSANGSTWTMQNLATNEYGSYLNFHDVAFGGGRFVAVGDNVTATSTDGTNWTSAVTNLYGYSITFGAGKFVAVGANTIATSTDGTGWVVQHTDNSVPLTDVAYGSGWFVISSGLYYTGLIKRPQTCWISSDGINWIKRSFNTPQGVGPVAFGNGTFVAGTQRGGILQSDPLVALNLKVASLPELQISGPRHRQYQIEYCDAVATTNGWSSLGTITATNDPALFEDWSGTNATQRFYRVALLP